MIKNSGLPSPFFSNMGQVPGQEPTNGGQFPGPGIRRQKNSPAGSSPPYNVSPRGDTCTQSPRCTCQDCVSAREKKKKKQVEDIDPDTLKKIQALEWEKKHG